MPREHGRRDVCWANDSADREPTAADRFAHEAISQRMVPGSGLLRHGARKSGSWTQTRRRDRSPPRGETAIDQHPHLSQQNNMLQTSEYFIQLRHDLFGPHNSDERALIVRGRVHYSTGATPRDTPRRPRTRLRGRTGGAHLPRRLPARGHPVEGDGRTYRHLEGHPYLCDRGEQAAGPERRTRH